MRQQVNLLVAFPKIKKSPLRLKWIAWGSVGLLFIFILLAVTAITETSRKHTAYQQVLAEQQTTQIQLQQLMLAQEKAGMAHSNAKKSKAEQERLISELQNAQELLQQINGPAKTNRLGFSNYLVELGQVNAQGVWLTGFTIEGGGEMILLQGVATQAELLPHYINNLLLMPLYSNKHFKLFDVTKRSNNNTQVTFSLTTGTPESADSSSGASAIKNAQTFNSPPAGLLKPLPGSQ